MSRDAFRWIDTGRGIPGVWFGTPAPHVPADRQFTHIVWAGGPHRGLCHARVLTVWEGRPGNAPVLCRKCCVLAVATWFPASGRPPARDQGEAPDPAANWWIARFGELPPALDPINDTGPLRGIDADGEGGLVDGPVPP
ncbi:hypothetical protein [Amycolatopsis anabasis]|uniref:hypothetical protein n=1 Tax=Amycolatopsis anabasis TaxID=1840409 RepID=UPI00131E1E25|nr:hypothetical protein [Amycolatopsis anabasis]